MIQGRSSLSLDHLGIEDVDVNMRFTAEAVNQNILINVCSFP